MNTQHTTASWRDYADRLTPDQIAWITGFEEHYPAFAELGDVTLNYAREHARQNELDHAGPGVVGLPDGTTASEWFDEHHPERWRSIYGQMHTVVEGVGEWSSGEVSVQAQAVQLANGDIEISPSDWPGVQVVCNRDNNLTTTQARHLAAALLKAADEAEGWMPR